ncbi:MAG: uroporphyrinogen-III synthase [Legionella sp.]|nr:uroporphyrinogen-III synthase [Legionella sp.]
MSSLNGLRILNTRPKQQAAVLSQSIIQAGGISIECPTLEILPTSNQLECLPKWDTIQKAIFISPNAVHYCLQGLNKTNRTWPSKIQVIAMGQSTACALETYQIKVHETPNISDSEHLLKLPSLQQVENQTILLVKGVGGRSIIEDALVRLGANPIKLLVYQRALPTFDPQWIHSIWLNDLVDIILITSVESLDNLLKLFGSKGKLWLQSKTCLVLSARLAQAASHAGFKNLIISPPNRMMHTLLRIHLNDTK